jgi:hypothetical protein
VLGKRVAKSSSSERKTERAWVEEQKAKGEQGEKMLPVEHEVISGAKSSGWDEREGLGWMVEEVRKECSACQVVQGAYRC